MALSGSDSSTSLLYSCLDDCMQRFYQNTNEIDERDDGNNAIHDYHSATHGGPTQVLEHEIEIDFNPKSRLHTIRVMETQRRPVNDNSCRAGPNSSSITESVVIVSPDNNEKSYSKKQTIESNERQVDKNRPNRPSEKHINVYDDPTKYRVRPKKRKGSPSKRGRSQTVRSHWDSRAGTREFD
mmetsp:Transcript_27877/g.39187  ORF Transcript_27877/g.39187 Transcript_27877/m.39187 type:complete len:183 (-) Transcript_27877:46-594(-)